VAWYVGTTNLPAVIRKCPKAFKANRIYGTGLFAVLSCEDVNGIRRVHLCETTRERNKALWKWDDSDCGVPDCSQDHIVLDFPADLTQPIVGANEPASK
jgi:hypothetical protein